MNRSFSKTTFFGEMTFDEVLHCLSLSNQTVDLINHGCTRGFGHDEVVLSRQRMLLLVQVLRESRPVETSTIDDETSSGGGGGGR